MVLRGQFSEEFRQIKGGAHRLNVLVQFEERGLRLSAVHGVGVLPLVKDEVRITEKLSSGQHVALDRIGPPDKGPDEPVLRGQDKDEPVVFPDLLLADDEPVGLQVHAGPSPLKSSHLTSNCIEKESPLQTFLSAMDFTHSLM